MLSIPKKNSFSQNDSSTIKNFASELNENEIFSELKEPLYLEQSILVFVNEENLKHDLDNILIPIIKILNKNKFNIVNFSFSKIESINKKNTKNNFLDIVILGEKNLDLNYDFFEPFIKEVNEITFSNNSFIDEKIYIKNTKEEEIMYKNYLLKKLRKEYKDKEDKDKKGEKMNNNVNDFIENLTMEVLEQNKELIMDQVKNDIIPLVKETLIKNIKNELLNFRLEKKIDLKSEIKQNIENNTKFKKSNYESEIEKNIIQIEDSNKEKKLKNYDFEDFHEESLENDEEILLETY